MQTMKNKVGRNLAKSWLGKSLIKVGQNVDEVWMVVGQLLVRNWSAFKAKEVGQYLDKSWTDFRANKVGQHWYKSSTDFRGSTWQNWAKLGREKVQRGYNNGTTFLRVRICQGYAKHMPEFRSNKLLQCYSSITPKIGKQLLQFFSNTSPEMAGQRLRRSYTNPTPKFKRFSLKSLSQQLPNDYPENKGYRMNKSGQSRYGIGTEIDTRQFGKCAVTCRWFDCVKVSSWVRQFGGCKVGQLLGKTGVDLEPFYPAIIQVIQPLSFIAHSLIVHNKRVSYGYTKVTPALHQEFSLFDIPRVSLYVVLPNQSL